ncbi:extensin family protein [Methyloceanibacter sp.]|uniref:extensin-like domain-containing protein n=1 Tax=Methyloceanibacter sp. TaxID=1965321 RepID=UPI003D6D8E37
MRLRILALVALCAWLPPLLARAEGDAPPLPDRNPLRPTGPVAAPVKPPPPPLPGEQPTVPWSEAEIDAARAKCKELLTGDPLDYEVLPPIKEGICGTPAPVLLRAVGTDPKVSIDPPATLSCPMADVLGEWLRDTVQPKAKKLFGSTVAKIQNASSYVCRNRYGGGTTPLSEHALANALDVSEFVLANGERVTVLDDWPKVVEVPPPPAANPNRAPEDKESVAASKHAEDGKTAKPTATKTSAIASAKAEPAPAPSPPPVAKEPEMDREAQFVTYLHEDACRRFGTVLGPEANAAHKNHFHLDMKKRRKGFCE